LFVVHHDHHVLSYDSLRLQSHNLDMAQKQVFEDRVEAGDVIKLKGLFLALANLSLRITGNHLDTIELRYHAMCMSGSDHVTWAAMKHSSKRQS